MEVIMKAALLVIKTSARRIATRDSKSTQRSYESHNENRFACIKDKHTPRSHEG